MRIGIGITIVDSERHSTCCGRWIFATVRVSDRTKCCLVFRLRRRSRQRQRPTAGIPNTRNAVLINKCQRVFAVNVVASDLNNRRFNVYVVDVFDVNRGIDNDRAIILGVVHRHVRCRIGSDGNVIQIPANARVIIRSVAESDRCGRRIGNERVLIRLQCVVSHASR